MWSLFSLYLFGFGITSIRPTTEPLDCLWFRALWAFMQFPQFFPSSSSWRLFTAYSLVASPFRQHLSFILTPGKTSAQQGVVFVLTLSPEGLLWVERKCGPLVCVCPSTMSYLSLRQPSCLIFRTATFHFYFILSCILLMRSETVISFWPSYHNVNWYNECNNIHLPAVWLYYVFFPQFSTRKTKVGLRLVTLNSNSG